MAQLTAEEVSRLAPKLKSDADWIEGIARHNKNRKGLHGPVFENVVRSVLKGEEVEMPGYGRILAYSNISDRRAALRVLHKATMAHSMNRSEAMTTYLNVLVTTNDPSTLWSMNVENRRQDGVKLKKATETWIEEVDVVHVAAAIKAGVPAETINQVIKGEAVETLKNRPFAGVDDRRQVIRMLEEIYKAPTLLSETKRLLSDPTNPLSVIIPVFDKESGRAAAAALKAEQAVGRSSTPNKEANASLGALKPTQIATAPLGGDHSPGAARS